MIKNGDWFLPDDSIFWTIETYDRYLQILDEKEGDTRVSRDILIREIRESSKR